MTLAERLLEARTKEVWLDLNCHTMNRYARLCAAVAPSFAMQSRICPSTVKTVALIDFCRLKWAIMK